MPNPNLAFATALAAAFADIGVEHACVSPGSRNTPLIAGFAAESRIRKWPILDERSAGFFAVGLARATGKPVALVCTSGTAAVEYHPAVVEASESAVPLLVLTADRPPELRNVGAPQTIDQIGLYGSSVRLFIDAPAPNGETTRQHAADLGTEAWLAATLAQPGPVHLNLPFREPLLTASPETTTSSPVRLPDIATPPPLDLADLATSISGRAGIIVAGRTNDPGFPTACTALAAATGYPVFADPLSGMRHGDHPLDLVLGCGDALATAGMLDRLEPDLVIRFGNVPTSKAIWRWLEDHPDIEQILVDTSGRDATHSATTILAHPSSTVANALTQAVPAPVSRQWSASWTEIDIVAGAVIRQALTEATFPNEPAIAHTVVAATPPGAHLTVGSSMPIRDVDTYSNKSSTSIRILGNRGTNGIDGVVSAALGTAASGHPAVVLLGDVSMFHDLNALGTAAQLDLPLTIVVVHNDGGGIFHFLPHGNPDVMDSETFETYVATPHHTDFLAVARALALEAHAVGDIRELAQLISNPTAGPRLIQLRTDRRANLDLHREIAAAIKQSLA
jgi:2-succinyl-5-enolpyruvyl-6-hydroxy-3-cyclohexene-1-carboxylate synthase